MILRGGGVSYYFNFKASPDIPEPHWLTDGHWHELKIFFAQPRTWRGHNLPYDLHMLAQQGIFPRGEFHCTKAIARVVYNEHPPGTYGLDDCAERIGLKKDDAVAAYIKEHELWDWELIPGKKQRKKLKHFERVPFDIIVPYGCRDAEICEAVGDDQEKAIQEVSDATPPGLPRLQNIFHNEKRLTASTWRMEHRGVRIDRPYCVRAAHYEADRAEKHLAEFKSLTGSNFSASNPLFQAVFASERDAWGTTDKGNPSFEGDVLQRLKNPAAASVLGYRDAKSRCDFYQGFLHHADANDVIHPHLDPGGTNSGRYSSSDPNLTNLTSEEGDDLKAEFVVRRAFIPRPGRIFIMPDWKAQEFRLLLNYVGAAVGYETEMIRLVKGGLDVHDATRQLLLKLGIDLPRSICKNGLFAILYGSGLDTLAWTIKGTREAARELRDAIFKAEPGIRIVINTIMQTAKMRGFIFNWAGRRSYCPDANFAYKFPNRLIQGGCADVCKFSLTAIDDYLQDKKSKLLLSIHDEIIVECAEDEAQEVGTKVQEIMETVYPAPYLPLLVDMEHSRVSLADKVKGLPI